MIKDNPTLYDQSILNGKRWDRQSNQTYVMPVDDFHQAFDNGDTEKIAKVVAKFVERHATIDAPRIAKLERYYLGDNDIHYWHNHKKQMNRADNRIASGFAKFITNMRVGYMLGKPIQFKYSEDTADIDQKVDDMLKDFNRANDEEYHEKVMKTNLSVTGRAYELMFSGDAEEDDKGNVLTPDVKMRPVDPSTAFVVYDTSIDQHSLFGVRYYVVNYDNKQTYFVDVYTDNTVYHYQSNDIAASAAGEYKLLDQEQHNFGAVPLTEYVNNENRTGDWESKLDEIDAYDLAMSEMANSEEDFANAKLMINGDIDFSDNMEEIKKANGDPVLDDDGQPIKVPKIDTKDPFLWLKPAFHDSANGTTVVPSSAQYLVKQLNESGWQIFINQLTSDIHKDTNTPNTTDDAFSGQSSGVALMYKLFGEDQEMSMQQSLYRRGLHRRLKLLGNYWSYNSELDDPAVMDNYKPDFTPNLPRNNADIVQMAVSLNNTGLLSDQTLREILAPVTGVSADAEQQRLDDEAEQDPDQDTTPFDGSPLQGANPADLAEARAQLAQQQQGQQKQPTQDQMSPEDFIRLTQRTQKPTGDGHA